MTETIVLSKRGENVEKKVIWQISSRVYLMNGLVSSTYNKEYSSSTLVVSERIL